MIQPLLPALGIGFLVGFRHAFEPDHLAAVTALSTRQGKPGQAARLGVVWGIGHTFSVAMVAAALIMLQVRVPEQFYHSAELAVATLLVALGVGTLVVEARRHREGLGRAHAHAHEQRALHVHPGPGRSTTGALVFGIAHGLAGSGAIVALLVATSSRLNEQVSYLAAFAVGTIAGMSLVSLLTGFAANVASRSGTIAVRRVRITAACASVAIGVSLAASVLRTMS